MSKNIEMPFVWGYSNVIVNKTVDVYNKKGVYDVISIIDWEQNYGVAYTVWYNGQCAHWFQ